MMKKNYTRKQIQKAINYWQRKLNMINEANSNESLWTFTADDKVLKVKFTKNVTENHYAPGFKKDFYDNFKNQKDVIFDLEDMPAMKSGFLKVFLEIHKELTKKNVDLCLSVGKNKNIKTGLELTGFDEIFNVTD